MDAIYLSETESPARDRVAGSYRYPDRDADEMPQWEWEEEMRRRMGPSGRRSAGRRRPQARGAGLGGPPQRPGTRRAPPGSPRSDRSASRAENLRRIQDCLNQATGGRLPVNGVMGPETRSAIRRFQKQQGLAVTGYANPPTRRALKAICRRTPAADGELEYAANPFDDLAPPQAETSYRPQSSGVDEPITRALRAVNPGQGAVRDRRAAIHAIDMALRGLDRIESKLRGYPGLRPLVSTGLKLQRLIPVRKHLSDARDNLVAAAPVGRLLSDTEVDARFQAAYNFLTNARQQWRDFLDWHTRYRTQRAQGAPAR